MQNTTAIVLSGALFIAGWGLATGYLLQPFASAWFEAAAAGAEASGRPGPKGAEPGTVRRQRGGRCTSDYVCVGQGPSSVLTRN